jgi:hypothetical protein
MTAVGRDGAYLRLLEVLRRGMRAEARVQARLFLVALAKRKRGVVR